MGVIGSVDQRLQKSFLGRSLRLGFMDTIGYDIHGFRNPVNRGYLGIKSNMSEVYGLGRSGASAPGMHGIYKAERAMGAGAGKSAAAALRAGGGQALKMAGKTIMSGFGLAFGIQEVYSGFQQGGIFGAAKGAGEAVLWNTAGRATLGALSHIPLPVGIAGVALAAAGYGAYQLGEAGQRYERRLKNLEVGGDENMVNAINSYGASTMRQRAATALNNSHINRRLALGNEASMFHSSFRR